MSNTNQTFDLTSAVKSIRTAKGWTQASLATTWGVTVNFVSQVENGRRGVSLKGMEIACRKAGNSGLVSLCPRRQPSQETHRHAATHHLGPTGQEERRQPQRKHSKRIRNWRLLQLSARAINCWATLNRPSGAAVFNICKPGVPPVKSQTLGLPRHPCLLESPSCRVLHLRRTDRGRAS